MKRKMSKGTLRIIAIIVFVVMVLLAALSAFGIWVCVQERVYADGGASLRQDALRYLSWKMDGTVLEYYDAYQSDPQAAEDYWAPYFSREKTNYFFRLRDADGKTILSSYTAPYQFQNTGILGGTEANLYADQSFDSAAAREEWLEEFSKDHKIEIENQWENTFPNGKTSYEISVEYATGKGVTVERYIAKDFQAKDNISRMMALADLGIKLRNAYPWLLGISALLALASMIYLIVTAGRRNEDGTIRLTWFDKIPLDLLAVIYVALAGISFALLENLFDWEMLVGAACLGPVWIALGIAFLMTLATRAKAGTFWKNNVITRVLKYLWRFCKWAGGALKTLVKNTPLFWKTLLVWAGLSLIEMLVIAGWARSDRVLIFWLLEKLILTPLILFGVIGLQRLRKGAKTLRDGDLESKVDLKYLYGPFREHAEDLNAITDGLQTAVDARVKSERMKAELITNVSHDIKTPLTSIVNYVDLLGREELQNERAKEYVDVLTRQSARLKKLTEDLVEASKASTGNITVNAAPVDLNVLLGQAAGEFSDRFAQKGLELVLTTDEKQPKIMADGQLLWRVFSNLMGNIVKYAMSGTRVYLTTSVRDDRAAVTFRNISNAPLNMTGDELTERFVRGDRSRTGGEGSGLGLSIARSLTELMGGQFTVTVDGDLFKAEMVFPQLNAQ